MKDKFIKAKEKIAEMKGQTNKASDEIMGSGPTNRHGMPKLPPEQHEVKDWPILDLGFHPYIEREEWGLEVTGKVANPIIYNWESFMALPQTEDVSDFHCVTSWSMMDSQWKGVRLSEILKRAQCDESASHIVFHAYDDYTTNIPLEEAMKSDVLLVHEWNGEPLTEAHGAPVRVITPQLWAWKGAKWISTIEVLDHDQPGFWEVRGYSNTAHPWKNDRYTGEKPEDIT